MDSSVFRKDITAISKYFRQRYEQSIQESINELDKELFTEGHCSFCDKDECVCKDQLHEHNLKEAAGGDANAIESMLNQLKNIKVDNPRIAQSLQAAQKDLRNALYYLSI